MLHLRLRGEMALLSQTLRQHVAKKDSAYLGYNNLSKAEQNARLQKQLDLKKGGHSHAQRILTIFLPSIPGV